MLPSLFSPVKPAAMPRATNPRRYPYQFYLVLSEALRPNHAASGFAIPCANRTEAARLRFRFYNFLHALKRSAAEDDRTLAAKADGLEFLLRDDTLIIAQRDTNAEARRLEQALALNTGAPAQAAEAPSAQAPQAPTFDDLIDTLLDGGDDGGA